MPFPFKSMQELVAHLEEKGRLLEIETMDQDQYELTAFLHRMWREKRFDAPAIRVKHIKQDGRVYDTPFVTNVLGQVETLCDAFGVEYEDGQSFDKIYPVIYDHLLGLMDKQYQMPLLPKTEIASGTAPSQEVVHTGDDVDLFDFPMLKHYPADSGRFVTAGQVFLKDPELGYNAGIHRMEIKDKAKTGVYFTAGSHNHQFVRRAQERGDKSIPVAVIIGCDPLSFTLTSTRLCGYGVDELEAVGGITGQPYEMVKAKTVDLMVPAHAEMVIEGTIPMDKIEKEGPFVEYTDYLGYSPPEGIEFIEVSAITHRSNMMYYSTWMGHQPRESNIYAGIPFTISTHIAAKKNNPNIVRVYRPFETNWHMIVMSIDKKHPGDGFQAGLSLLGDVGQGTMVKIVVVVDKWVNPANWSEVVHEMGAHWQPGPGSLILPQTRGYHLEHSTKTKGLTSKIVIDCTRQLPEEGGPDRYEPRGIEIMRDGAAEGIDLMNMNWDKYWEGFQE